MWAHFQVDLIKNSSLISLNKRKTDTTLLHSLLSFGKQHNCACKGVDHLTLCECVYMDISIPESYPCFDLVRNLTFLRIMRNLVIHITLWMIQTVSKFLITCVQLCLDSAISQPWEKVYMPQYPCFYWSTPSSISRFLKTKYDVYMCST